MAAEFVQHLDHRWGRSQMDERAICGWSFRYRDEWRL
jgi:hypothetical protein